MRIFMSIMSAAALILFGGMASAWALAPGDKAPAFTATNAKGETVSLSDYDGKVVVLEWTNHLCPFVKKHYNAGNMQRVQRMAESLDAVWLTVNSSAEGKQGYVEGAEALKIVDKNDAVIDHYLIDPEGKLGKSYGAKTTPHMFVINTDGTIAYMGAIDDKPTADSADIAGAVNYVIDTLDAIKDGDPIPTQSSQPYGCSVKYKG